MKLCVPLCGVFCGETYRYTDYTLISVVWYHTLVDCMAKHGASGTFRDRVRLKAGPAHQTALLDRASGPTKIV